MPGAINLGRKFWSSDVIATVARQGLGILVVRIASLLLLFGVQALLARLLGVDQFGAFVVALAVMGVLQLFARQGFEIAASRFVGTYLGLRQWGLLRGFVAVGQLAVLGGAAFFGIALVAVAAWLEERLGVGMMHGLWLAAAILPVFTLLQLEAAVVRGLGHAAISDVPTWIIHPLALGAGVAASILLFDAEARATTALAVYLVAAVPALAVQHIMMHRLLPKPVRSSTPEYRSREWMKVAPAMMLFAGSAMLLSQVNTVVLGAISSAAEAGIYSIAVRIAGIMQLITYCFIGTVGPVAARLHATGQRAELERVIVLGARAVFFTALAALAMLVLAGRPILNLFGEEFVDGYGALIVVAAGQLTWAATVPAGVLLNMTGYHNESARILLLSTAINLVLCILLVPPLGGMGAAISTAVAMALWNGLMAVSAQRLVGIKAHVTFGFRAAKEMPQ